MIALPGLTLYSGREKHCLEILKTFAKHEKEERIPNFIGDTPEKTAYNSADAGLWFAWAVQKYLEKTRDTKSVYTFLWSTLKRIFLHYKQGTLFNIKMHNNGLLHVGGRNVQVTWMDATAFGKPVTPRDGCPVEINALWYNLVCFIDEMGLQFRDNITNETETLKDTIKRTFNKHFWIPEGNYLGDVYRENRTLDKTLRPNQVFALSLPYSPISGEKAQSVLKRIEEELLTPRGLRTLSQKDKNYHGRYEGGPDERDSAYHNGTVWPWLLGHYGEAVLKFALNKKREALKLDKF
ncbi:MAG: amylo-alpha-1,6-glucosidase, partial [Nitrospinota bacterium]|nr:amylo-alpha-1,6-glucosidase [Nitrospinota bacterium]